MKSRGGALAALQRGSVNIGDYRVTVGAKAAANDLEKLVLAMGGRMNFGNASNAAQMIMDMEQDFIHASTTAMARNRDVFARYHIDALRSAAAIEPDPQLRDEALRQAAQYETWKMED